MISALIDTLMLGSRITRFGTLTNLTSKLTEELKELESLVIIQKKEESAKNNEKNLNLFFLGNLNLKYSKFRCIVVIHNPIEKIISLFPKHQLSLD